MASMREFFFAGFKRPILKEKPNRGFSFTSFWSQLVAIFDPPPGPIGAHPKGTRQPPFYAPISDNLFILIIDKYSIAGTGISPQSWVG
jgi:hypothetical protein